MKNNRHDAIIKLIKEKVLLTQEDLQNELIALGYNVTQSTVSRDIKELKIVKGHDIYGNYRYIFNQVALGTSHSGDHYREMFSKAVISVDYAINNVVIKCHTGMASSACVAVDELYGDMMLGSLAGEDTIIIVTQTEERSALLASSLSKLL